MGDPWQILAQKIVGRIGNWWDDQVRYSRDFPGAARAAMDALDRDERLVLELRCGMRDGRSHTLEEVGRELGVTRERVRQIEARAVRKLRRPQYGLLKMLVRERVE